MKRTILLADDSVTIQKVVELTFLDEDLKVVSVGNGSDALAKFDEIRPDLVLADVHMPGADGYEVCDAARRSLPGVPVLLLVGTFEVFDPERAAAVGAAGHLKKPFDSQELLRRVRELLERGVSSVSAPMIPIEPPSWDAAPSAPGASDSLPGEDWSFVPEETEAAPSELPEVEASSEAVPASSSPAELFGAPSEATPEGESWSSFATSRFTRESMAAAVAAPPPDELEAEFEPEAEPETYELQSMAPAAPEPSATAPSNGSAAGGGPMTLSDADVERIARRVTELMAERAVRDVAWEVVPDLAEVLLKARIRELEASVE